MTLCRQQPQHHHHQGIMDGFCLMGGDDDEGSVSFSPAPPNSRSHSLLASPPGSTPPTSLLRKRSSEEGVRIPPENTTTGGTATVAKTMDSNLPDHEHQHIPHEGSCCTSSSTTSSSSVSSCRPLSPPNGSMLLSTSPPRTTALRTSSQQQTASHIRSKFLLKLGIDSKNVIDRPASQNRRKTSSCTTGNKSVSSRPRSGSFQESLKADYGLPAVKPLLQQRQQQPDVVDNSPSDADDCNSTASSSSADTAVLSTSSSSLTNQTTNIGQSQQERRQPRSVSFDAAVTVHPIPRRSEYSNRIRGSLWTPVSELQENAARNCVEFAAENWDWRQAANDDDMVLYQGEKIHPIHFMVQQQHMSPPVSPTKAAGSCSPQQDQEFSLRRMLFAVLSAQQDE